MLSHVKFNTGAKNFGDALLELVHQAYQLSEVVLVFDGGVLEKGIIQSPDEEQELAPVNVSWIPHLMLLLLSTADTLRLHLLHSIQVLFI